MKTKFLLAGSALLFSSLFQSCSKEEEASMLPEEKVVSIQNSDQLQTTFAKILAPALHENEELRKFLKEEALKEFDKDYDILYQMVKNTKVGDKTFREILLQYSSEEELNAIETELPLLTLFVPELPDFSAHSWNTTTEVPLTTANLSAGDNLPFYDHEGKKYDLDPSYIPAFPVIVIKQNERIVTSRERGTSNSGNRLADGELLVHENEIFSFYFADEAFNGNKKENKNIESRFSLDPSPAVIDAYRLGMEWQRDHIYYGLTPSKTTGEFRNNYSEFIASMKLSPDALAIISDQKGDPSRTYSGWTEGNFEFTVTILINAQNGLGSEITKIFSVKPTDVYELVSEYKGSFYKVLRTKTKEYYPNIELLPWDLENYGMAWKFIFHEFDLSEKVTEQHNVSSTHATNFGFDASIGGEKSVVKLGLKYGKTSTRQVTSTHSITTNLESDFLGEATLTFDQPVILAEIRGIRDRIYAIREITTGNLLTVSIEPKKVF